MAIPPPPLVIQDDDPSLVNSARRRLAPKSSFARLLSLPNLNRRFWPSFSSLIKQQNSNTPDLSDNTPINLDDSALIDQDFVEDRFEWAVLYENQRGQVLS
jgi:hypothetical protein